MKSVDWYVPVVLYTMLYPGALAFESVGKFLRVWLLNNDYGFI